MNKNINYAEAVGAIIVAQDYPDLFLGVTHQHSKRISARIGDSLQLSLLTETRNTGETVNSAFDRMLKVEELYVDGLSDKTELNPIPLCRSLIETKNTHAILDTFLFCVPFCSQMRIIDGEISEVGWVDINSVVNSRNNAWWLRPSLHESLNQYLKFKDGRLKVIPTFTTLKDPPQFDLYDLLEQGYSEREALLRLNLIDSNQLQPWNFIELKATLNQTA